jgi:hypothetical protein
MERLEKRLEGKKKKITRKPGKKPNEKKEGTNMK